MIKTCVSSFSLLGFRFAATNIINLNLGWCSAHLDIGSLVQGPKWCTASKASAWKESPTGYWAHRSRCKDNNVGFKCVQPHFKYAWLVEPCQQLEEVARCSSWAIDTIEAADDVLSVSRHRYSLAHQGTFDCFFFNPVICFDLNLRDEVTCLAY